MYVYLEIASPFPVILFQGKNKRGKRSKSKTASGALSSQVVSGINKTGKNAVDPRQLSAPFPVRLVQGPTKRDKRRKSKTSSGAVSSHVASGADEIRKAR